MDGDQDIELTRRRLLQLVGGGVAALAVGQSMPALADVSNQTARPIDTFTGPKANPFWNSVGPFVSYPEKTALIRLTDRPVQLETPRHYFRDAFTPNSAFFVRYHLAGEPNTINVHDWRVHVEGRVKHRLALSLADLLHKFEPVELAAVCQCSGNSRSRFYPRVAGGEWGDGAVGNALWTGVRLKDVLKKAGIASGAVQIQFQGAEFGAGPLTYPSHGFMKSFNVDDPAIDRAIIAYAMNGEPLPMLNGFPARLVFPGKFATYWTKAITWIRVLDHKDDNFWMTTAYTIPDTPNGDTTPADVKAGKVKMVPIGNVDMPVRSFIVTPDGSAKIPAGLPVVVRGVAFSGTGKGIRRVEVSEDGGRSWHDARLGKDYGPYSFRTWEHDWKPARAGRAVLAVRATDGTGVTQPDHGVWNPGGYLWNKIQRQEIVVGPAS